MRIGWFGHLPAVLALRKGHILVIFCNGTCVANGGFDNILSPIGQQVC